VNRSMAVIPELWKANQHLRANSASFREGDFWGVEIGWVNPSAFMEGNRREHVGLIRVWEI